ncbi:MAG: cupin [Gammaproteobacteria bacterium]|nr:cupin [Gammaproteobacteria bacterium]
MTTLSIYDESGNHSGKTLTNFDEIKNILSDQGVLFEQWEASSPLTDSAEQEEVLTAYTDSIELLKKEYNIQSVDVVALRPDNPQKTEFRQKFLAEHIHKDFEIRFFVDGSGLFYLHVGEKVFLILCEKGDLISVPANTAHWFDMGENPSFKCIRLFTTEDGWLADFTGSDIATRFPDMDSFVANSVKNSENEQVDTIA